MMTKYIFRLPISNMAGIMILAALSGCSTKKSNESLQNATIGIDDIKLKSLDGGSVDLSQYEGKVLFVNVWATWCRPCIEEMPSIERAQSILRDRKVEFLFASNEEPDLIRHFIKNRSLKVNCVQLENMEGLKIQALPTTFIFDIGGRLAFSESGFRKWDEASNIELITKIIDNHE